MGELTVRARDLSWVDLIYTTYTEVRTVIDSRDVARPQLEGGTLSP